MNILKKLERKEDFDCGLPQNEDQIQELESELNVKFPLSYKEFLQMYGYVSWLGGEIYGPSDDEYCDLLMRNKEAREMELSKDFFSLPKDAFVFKGYLGGGILCFSAIILEGKVKSDCLLTNHSIKKYNHGIVLNNF